MFNFTKNETASSKCYTTRGTLGHLDPKQPPTKRQPFSTLLNVPFVHKIDLILPHELHATVMDTLNTKLPGLKYSRVILPLGALLEGEFFNEFIKRGNVIMLSEGKYGVDNVYSLRDGILRLSLDKESYERAGLAGKPDGVKGTRGTRARWVVEINLRLPSMLHGKKGFDRIVYGCKNALPSPVTWLFSNLDNKVLDVDPLVKHFPTSVSITPFQAKHIETILPNLSNPITSATSDADFQDTTTDLYEWLSLVLLQSPRMDPRDDIDSYLSRYAGPQDEASDNTPMKLAKISWHGFMSATVAHQIFITTMAKLSRESWFVLAVGGFGNSLPSSGSATDCMMLKCGGGENEFLSWVVES